MEVEPDNRDTIASGVRRPAVQRLTKVRVDIYPHSVRGLPGRLVFVSRIHVTNESIDSFSSYLFYLLIHVTSTELS